MGLRSAGLLLFRRTGSPRELEVFLVHPGGPYAAKRDDGAWSIPKGMIEAGENELDAARRELQEETGFTATGEYIPIGEIRQASGKIVVAWAVEQDVDITKFVSNTFQIEWPPKSGRLREFPEMDRAGWFSLAVARQKMLQGQPAFLDRLVDALE